MGAACGLAVLFGCDAGDSVSPGTDSGGGGSAAPDPSSPPNIAGVWVWQTPAEGLQDRWIIVQSGSRLTGTLGMWKPVDRTYDNGAQWRETAFTGSIEGREITLTWQFTGDPVSNGTGTLAADGQTIASGSRTWARGR